eukprot:GHVN01049885.1.p1 GENE.GHVN01049885.1~~GHVN01049885.1.p1  ORF type:complete len:108 (+),score=1.95 GHVN01049885.1:2-325(+)
MPALPVPSTVHSRYQVVALLASGSVGVSILRKRYPSCRFGRLFSQSWMYFVTPLVLFEEFLPCHFWALAHVIAGETIAVNNRMNQYPELTSLGILLFCSIGYSCLQK